ncbi:MAG: hypothetical protein GX495_12145 [Chloroflexi bacterium]|jgi:hypothetical protein|nr:hypothetical protein [Chloroflexota bacterium]
MTSTPISSIPNIRVYPRSIHSGNLIPADNEGAPAVPVTCFLAQNEAGEHILGVRSDSGAPLPFTEPLFVSGEDQFFAANEENAAILRRIFPWLNPAPLEPAGMPSFGFGDRLGLATPGHIQALRAAGSSPVIAPVFAQQSVRENTRTGRTPQQVLDEAMWGVFQEGWHSPWGADADHLKQLSDLEPFVKAGYSFYTVDPGEHVDPAADSDTPEILREKIAAQPWSDIDIQPISADELASSFQRFCSSAKLECDPQMLKTAALRAMAKYGRAVLHITKMYRALQDLKPDGFDFEASVDETDSPTTVFEHFYIASELRRLGVRFTSLAPRLTGRFEKGVDYIGDLQALEAELQQHVAVMIAVGGYKLSLHSGSDKFSLYPLFARRAGTSVHVKTAGTSYLEALRVTASYDPDLFREILALARRRYAVDRQSYHVSALEERLPEPEGLADDALPGLLDDFHVRQALHVTFGSALAQYGAALKDLLRARPEAYEQVLLAHFKRHLDPLLDL